MDDKGKHKRKSPSAKAKEPQGSKEDASPQSPTNVSSSTGQEAVHPDSTGSSSGGGASGNVTESKPVDVLVSDVEVLKPSQSNAMTDAEAPNVRSPKDEPSKPSAGPASTTSTPVQGTAIDPSLKPAVAPGPATAPARAPSDPVPVDPAGAVTGRWEARGSDVVPFTRSAYSAKQDQEPYLEPTTMPTTMRKTTPATSSMLVPTETTLLLDVNPYVRLPLVLLNMFIWFLGISIILVGLYAYFETGGDARYSNTRTLYSWILVRLEVAVMAVGATMVSLSLCGCLGALRENTCLLTTYSYFITALLLINLLIGLLVFFLPSQFKRFLRHTLTKNLVVHYRDSADLQEIIDSVQTDLQCCGVTQRSFRDWNDNIYFNCSHSNPSYERCSVPHSCCRRNESDPEASLFCGRGVLNKTDFDAWYTVYTNNCVDAAHSYVRQHVTLITGMCLVVVILLAFVQMVTQAVIDEIVIIRKIYDKFYDRVHDIRVAQGLSTESPPTPVPKRH
ncbi:tetraspanin-14-like [Ornithodoros turicata]|uniref:tetraspanin-14-like n=1 Tax=Ornithodoros turicata TaxID=34597 RepID=UPI0031390FCE